MIGDDRHGTQRGACTNDRCRSEDTLARPAFGERRESGSGQGADDLANEHEQSRPDGPGDGEELDQEQRDPTGLRHDGEAERHLGPPQVGLA